MYYNNTSRKWWDGFHANINDLSMLIKCIYYKNLVIKQGLIEEGKENLFQMQR